jgi:hypothetical protein
MVNLCKHEWAKFIVAFLGERTMCVKCDAFQRKGYNA